MINKAIDRLNQIIEIAPNLLKEISEKEMSHKPAPTKWSKKQILGHLIDSATNNHQRLIRAQYEITPEIKYDQDKWNEFNFYQEIDTNHIINLWTIYNTQLLEIIKRIPNEKLTNQLKYGENIMPLEFVIVDYVKHLEHHLSQIIEY